jgi:hypothetical protein
MPRIEYSSEALAKGYQTVALELGCNVWEFLTGIDTAKSYQAFVCYRDLGVKRTFDKLAIAVDKFNESFIKQIGWTVPKREICTLRKPQKVETLNYQ